MAKVKDEGGEGRDAGGAGRGRGVDVGVCDREGGVGGRGGVEGAEEGEALIFGENWGEEGIGG